MAVLGLVGLDRKPKAVYREHNVKVLGEASMKLLT
jgi:hypothetical protein